MNVMSPEQCRAARAWLGWSQQDLVDATGIGIQAIFEYELRRRGSRIEVIAALQTALELSGARFLFDDAGNSIGIYGGDTPPDFSVQHHFVMTRELCRAARAWLDWTQEDLVAHTKVACSDPKNGRTTYRHVSLSTIRDFEKNRLRRGRRYQPKPENLAAIQEAFTENGIRFLFSPEGRPLGIASAKAERLAA